MTTCSDTVKTDYKEIVLFSILKSSNVFWATINNDLLLLFNKH